jgi:hypothetical protein
MGDWTLGKAIHCPQKTLKDCAVGRSGKKKEENWGVVPKSGLCHSEFFASLLILSFVASWAPHNTFFKFVSVSLHLKILQNLLQIPAQGLVI